MAQIRYTAQIQGSAKSQGETNIIRNPQYLNGDLIWQPPEGQNNVKQVFDLCFKKYADFPCFGTRNVVGYDSKGKPEFSPYEWKSFKQVETMAKKLGHIINAQGMCGPNSEGVRFLTCFSRNMEQERIFQIAAAYQNIVCVPIFDAAHIDSVFHILKQTEVTTVCTTQNHIQQLLSLQQNKGLKTLKWIVQLEGNIDAQHLQLAQNLGVGLISYFDLINLTEYQESYPPEQSPEDLYFICYTSGTTAESKGAMLTHRNFLASIMAFQLYPEVQLIPGDDRYLSYLPYAHVFEQFIFFATLYNGCKIGFYNGDVQRIAEDLAALKPTFFASVPRLYQRFYDKIMQKVTESKGIKKILVDKGIRAKLQNVDRTGINSNWLWDKLVFNKMKAVLGGNVRYMLTGAAPITSDLKRFIGIAMCCPFYEGFGQTENMAAAMATRYGDPSSGHAGGPVATIELKIIDVPEMNYFVTDKASTGEQVPRGELLTRGPCIFKGYYKKPDLTAETIDADGWVHTGDVVALLPGNGAIKIIDRRKNIFKLSQGEYIAPEKIEGVYNLSPFVAMNFVYGESLQPHLVGIIIPEEDYIMKKWAPANNVSDSFQELCKSQQLKKAILDSITKVSRENKLTGLEIVKEIYLHPEPFSVDNGLLTPTMKLKRYQAKVYFEQQIKQLYAIK